VRFYCRLFGYAAAEATNYSKTSIMSEGYLARKGTWTQVFTDPDAQISLLGVVESSSDEVPPQLLYGITESNEDAAIENQLQFSACILNQSKNIFFGKVLTILRFFMAEHVEPIYLGKCTHAAAAAGVLHNHLSPHNRH
jgi:hypothetical protein